MDKKAIYSKIKEIAGKLSAVGDTWTRADLAYELRPLGVGADSMDVAKLVYDTFVQYNDKSVRKAFLTNDRKHFLVDAYKATFESGQNMSKAFSTIKGHMEQGESSLTALQKDINRVVGKASSESADFLSLLTGTKAASEIGVQAKAVFERYAGIISSYETAKGDVKLSMTDFIFLREKVFDLFMEYSMTLVDIFGDSIKVVSPVLFDFNSVEWLDVKKMLETVKLEYDNIASSCSALVGEISENFSLALKNSSEVYRNSGNRKVGMALAGLNMFCHYLDSSERTTVLKQDFVRFSDKIKKDSFTIKADLSRLFLIYRTLNELYIPKAEAFFRYSSKIFSKEFEDLINSLYSTPELSKIREERTAILSQYKELQQSIIDCQLNIDVYTSSIAVNQNLLDTNRQKYNEAMARKPQKPLGLLNILTLGQLGKRYNRDLTEWYENYSSAIEYYESLRTDLKLDKEELEQLSDILKENRLKANKLKTQLDKASKQLKDTLKASDSAKIEVAGHLNDIIKLLHIAKDIVASGLDEKYLKAVRLGEYSAVAIPDDVEKRLESFTDSLRQNVSTETLRPALDMVKDDLTTSDGEVSEQDMSVVSEASGQAVQKIINIFEEYARLEEMKRQSEITDRQYQRYLADIQSEFNESMKTITKKGDVLRESLRKMNLSTSSEELKAGLVSLSGDKIVALDDDEFKQFLNGTKDIII